MAATPPRVPLFSVFRDKCVDQIFKSFDTFIAAEAANIHSPIVKNIDLNAHSYERYRNQYGVTAMSRKCVIKSFGIQCFEQFVYRMTHDSSKLFFQ